MAGGPRGVHPQVRCGSPQPRGGQHDQQQFRWTFTELHLLQNYKCVSTLDNEEEKLDPSFLESEECNFEETEAATEAVTEAVADNEVVEEEEEQLASFVCHSAGVSLLPSDDPLSLPSMGTHWEQETKQDCHEQHDFVSLLAHHSQDQQLKPAAVSESPELIHSAADLEQKCPQTEIFDHNSNFLLKGIRDLEDF